jgi:hypothetical protein
MIQKGLKWLEGAGRYLLFRVLPYVAAVSAAAALSFLVTRDFSFTRLSERVFWVGLVIFLVAGTVAFAHMLPGRALLFPYNIRKPEDAKKFIEEMPTARATADKRFDIGIQLWLIALGCLGLSALIQTLLG